MPYKTRKPAKTTPPPQTEIELQKLQALYIEDKNNKEVRDNFFLLLRNYARSIALQNIKRTTIFLPPERVDEICTDATLELIEQYSKEGWRVDSSFAGVLFWKVQHAMYGQKDDEKNSSLNTTFDDSDSNSKEVMDIVSFNSDLPWNSEINGYSDPTLTPEDSLIKNVDVSYSEVKEIIEEAYDILPFRTFMRFVPWLVLQFRKPKTRNIQLLFSTLFLTNKEENAFDILLLEIHNRISNHVL